MAEEFDAIIIGAGQSGPFLAVRLAEQGQKVAIIEREHLGGTCVNDGRTPTKTLIASARAAWMAPRSAEYGVHIGGPISVDMKAVKARKDKVISASIKSLTDWQAINPFTSRELPIDRFEKRVFILPIIEIDA